MTFHVPRGALVVLALIAAVGVGVIATLILTGGADNDTRESVATVTTQESSSGEESEVRATLEAYFQANSTGDFEQVCSLFTREEQKEAAESHSPGSADCVEAFRDEAEGLGESLAAANEIYANAKIDSISVANDAATAVILYGGGSEPNTAELRKAGGRWLIDEEP